MTLHLLHSARDPLALQTLKAQSSMGCPPPVLVLLCPGDPPPPLAEATVHWLTTTPRGNPNREIGYARLVDMIFAADKVIAW
jgi:hypothetical protein